MKNGDGEKTLKLALGVVMTATVTILIGGGFLSLDYQITKTVSAQQDPFLSQRINRIEQQLNSIETRMIRLESASRISPAITPRAGETNDAQTSFLLSQFDSWQSRLAAIECGLLRLDERTLPSASRVARKKTAASEAGEQPCRLNPNAPLQILARP